ncbi:hypothetical protein OG742_11355 [Streptomyces sp. NBC_00828]|uniref:hypothetical protein n=1 Tax=Streptomyces sp. NBC_00828 TaxID=2903678 RepID=UPI0038708EBD
MTTGKLPLNRSQLAALAALVSAHPGRTLDEHLAAADKITERQLIQQGLISLVHRREVRRDAYGRIWPVG